MRLKHWKKLFCTVNKALLTGSCDRRQSNSDDANATTDENLKNRAAKFANMINGESTYRIRLRVLCDIGLVNDPIKLNKKLSTP